MFERLQRQADADFRRTVVVHQFADDRQQRHFPHDHFAPRPGEANIQLTMIVDDGDLAWVVTEVAQPGEIVLREERQGGQPAILIVLQLQVAHGFNLLANRVGIDAEQVVSAAAELCRHLHIIVAVEDGLLHMQLIGIRIKQRVQYRRSELCHGAQ